MTPGDIAKARAAITDASKGPMTWTHDEHETPLRAETRMLKAYRAALSDTGSGAVHTVEVDRRDDGTCLVFAFTGNGRKSAANAQYIVGSFDPVAGWAAALDEVERQRKVMREHAATIGRQTHALEIALHDIEQQRAQIAQLAGLVREFAEAMPEVEPSYHTSDLKVTRADLPSLFVNEDGPTITVAEAKYRLLARVPA